MKLLVLMEQKCILGLCSVQNTVLYNVIGTSLSDEGQANQTHMKTCYIILTIERYNNIHFLILKNNAHTTL